LRDKLHELDKNKIVYEYCQVGLRGYIASRIVEQNGFAVKNLTGGVRSYSLNSFKVEYIPEKSQTYEG
jgi:rhodanese-related sulfurtransferase